MRALKTLENVAKLKVYPPTFTWRTRLEWLRLSIEQKKTNPAGEVNIDAHASMMHPGIIKKDETIKTNQ
ncbi:hypothetical protein M0802_003765 [Mischocyttarus mexicanus]|nr:hypothetical protein M0802_003765 [Mischocyttarus mexicanus]